MNSRSQLANTAYSLQCLDVNNVSQWSLKTVSSYLTARLVRNERLSLNTRSTLCVYDQLKLVQW